jgi:hypothetical protein
VFAFETSKGKNGPAAIIVARLWSPDDAQAVTMARSPVAEQLPSAVNLEMKTDR